METLVLHRLSRRFCWKTLAMILRILVEHTCSRQTLRSYESMVGGRGCVLLTSHADSTRRHSASFCNLRSNKENKFAEFRCIVWVCRGLSEIKCSKCLPFQGANRERSCPASPSALRWAGGDAIHGLYHWNLPMGSNGYIPNVWAISMGNMDEKHVGSCSALV